MSKLRVCLDCHELTEDERCGTHKAKARATARFSEDPRYRTQRWTDYSKAFRTRHPLCALHLEGCTLVAEVVDHIHPVKTHPHLFWEPTNHRPACQHCNQRVALQARATHPSTRGGVVVF